MSTFLIYVETGKPVRAELPGPPIVARSLSVRNAARTTAIRAGLALTDGLASDHFRNFSNQVAGRAGTALREALMHFLERRLQLGVVPHLAFLLIEGALTEVALDLDSPKVILWSEVDEGLRAARDGDVLQIV